MPKIFSFEIDSVKDKENTQFGWDEEFHLIIYLDNGMKYIHRQPWAFYNNAIQAGKFMVLNNPCLAGNKEYSIAYVPVKLRKEFDSKIVQDIEPIDIFNQIDV